MLSDKDVDAVVTLTIIEGSEVGERIATAEAEAQGDFTIQREDAADDLVEQVAGLECDGVVVDIVGGTPDLMRELGTVVRESGPVVVVVSDDRDLAVPAFEAGVLDFILRPATSDRLREALHRMRREVLRRRERESARAVLSVLSQSGDAPIVGDEFGRSAGSYAGRLLVRERGRVFFVDMDEIRYVQSDGNYLQIHVAEEFHLARGTMDEVQSRLDPSRFVRIHRSTIVNMRWVKEFRPDLKGRYSVTLLDGTELVLSRGYRESVLELAL